MKDAGRSRCPISLSLEMIGDRWSLLVLRDLILRGKQRYGEFLESPEGIATNILADRLARLEDCGLISRSRDPENRKQVLYSPTKRGLDFLPVLIELIRWGLKHEPRSGTLPPGLQRMRANERQYKKEILARFGRV